MALRPVVFENGVSMGVLRPKREEVTKGWRKVHNKEPQHFYSSPNIIRVTRRMRLVGYVALMGG
jgi:hypothetical protein